MPPVVHSEIARPPVPYRGRKEGHAILLSTLHLEDVSEGMHCPYVARVLVEGRSGASLGLTVVGVLLEAECVDALKVAPARLVGRPGAQDAGGDIAEVQPAAHERAACRWRASRGPVRSSAPSRSARILVASATPAALVA